MSPRKLAVGTIRQELFALLVYLAFLGAVGILCYLNHLSLRLLADFLVLTWIPVTVGLVAHTGWQLARHHKVTAAIAARDAARLPTGTPLTQAYAGALANSWRESRAAIERAQARLDQQRDYLTLWSHELKTPLTTLSLMAQRTDLVPAEAIAPVVVSLRAQVSMLLNLERAEQIEHDLHLAPLDLARLVRGCLREQRTWFTSRHLRLQVMLAPGTVVSDPKWLSVVVEQLLINAAKYAAPGGWIGIRVSSHRLTIFNQGPPIATADLPRIFEPGFTGRAGDQAGEATGMGLYLVKQVVVALGGRITVTNVKDGVQALLTLPTK